MLELQDGTRKNDKQSTFTQTCTDQTTSWLVHSWSTFGARTSHRWNTNSQDPPRFGLGGSHHLPPYSILCAWPQDQHSNVILSQDSQVGVSKFPKLKLLWLWRPITLCAYLQLKWGLRKSYNTRWEFSNDMWHTTFTQINWGDSWFLVVGLSFHHNLCFNYSNGSCKPILNICVPKDFQWYMERFNPMGFDPYNCFLKFESPSRHQLAKWESTWECGGSILTFSHTFTLLGAWNVTFGLHSWPAPLQALAFVASPRLQLRHCLL